MKGRAATSRKRRALRLALSAAAVAVAAFWGASLASSVLELRGLLGSSTRLAMDVGPEPGTMARSPASLSSEVAEANAIARAPAERRELAAMQPESMSLDDRQMSEVGIDASGSSEPEAVFSGFGSEDAEAQQEAAAVMAEMLTDFADRFASPEAMFGN